MIFSLLLLFIHIWFLIIQHIIDVKVLHINLFLENILLILINFHFLLIYIRNKYQGKFRYDVAKDESQFVSVLYIT